MKSNNEQKAHAHFMQMRDKTIAAEQKAEQSVHDLADNAAERCEMRRRYRMSNEMAAEGREEATMFVQAVEEEGYDDLEEYTFIDEQYWDEKKHGEKPSQKLKQRKFSKDLQVWRWGWWKKWERGRVHPQV